MDDIKVYTYLRNLGRKVWVGIHETLLKAKVVQDTGNSAEDVMSQKAVTDEFAALGDAAYRDVGAAAGELFDSGRVVQSLGQSPTSVMSQKAVDDAFDALGDAAHYDVGTESGELMEVGAFGIGSDTAPNVTDLNEATANGFYHIQGDADNSPATADGGLLAFGTLPKTPGSSTGDLGQLAYFHGENLFIRNADSMDSQGDLVWSPWRRVMPVVSVNNPSGGNDGDVWMKVE